MNDEEESIYDEKQRTRSLGASLAILSYSVIFYFFIFFGKNFLTK